VSERERREEREREREREIYSCISEELPNNCPSLFLPFMASINVERL
jgi:hypothetical protein